MASTKSLNASSVSKKTAKIPVPPLRLIQFQREWIAQSDIDQLPPALRGIYVLYKTIEQDGATYRNVVYVGMSNVGIKGRLRKHKRHKAGEWDTCSVFVVWPNILESEIRELEGVLRHIFRMDSDAQKLNSQGAYLKLLRHTPLVPFDEANVRKTEYVSDEEETADAEVVPVEKTLVARPKKPAAQKRGSRASL